MFEEGTPYEVMDGLMALSADDFGSTQRTYAVLLISMPVAGAQAPWLRPYEKLVHRVK